MSLDSDDSANFKQSKKTFKKKSRTRGGEINYTKLKHFACAEVMVSKYTIHINFISYIYKYIYISFLIIINF